MKMNSLLKGIVKATVRPTEEDEEEENGKI